MTFGIASTAAVTVPVAKWMLPGHPLAALLLGMIPVIPYLLNVVVFAALFMVIMIVSIVGMTVYVASGRGDPIKCMNALLMWCTSAPIAVVTLTPLSESPAGHGGLAKPKRKKKQDAAPVVAALPGAEPAVGSQQDTPHYWRTFQNMAAEPGGAPDVVPTDTPATEQAPVGRHAKREPAPERRIKVS